MFKKILSITVCLFLIFEQSGFGQILGLSPVPAYLSSFPTVENNRPIQLRSIAFDNINQSFNLIIDKGSLITKQESQIQEASKQLLQFFRIGLALSNDKFWVNLRPDDSSRIIDQDLERTDVGKILLEADLQLKKDLAAFTSPATAQGKLYWTRLYEKSAELFGEKDVEIPTITRPWIVPGEIIIGLSGNSAFIYKATMKVMLERDYLKTSSQQEFSDPKVRQLNEYSSDLIKRLILPELNRQVNSGEKYSALRQVYYSLILSQWFKAKYRNSSVISLSKDFDSLDLNGLTSKAPWSKDGYYQAYRKSFTEGEYKLDEQVRTSGGVEIRQYFSGGILLPVQEAQVTILPNPGLFDSTMSAVSIPLNGLDWQQQGQNDGGKQLQLLKESGSEEVKRNIANLGKIYGEDIPALEKALRSEFGPYRWKNDLQGMFTAKTRGTVASVPSALSGKNEGLIFSGGAGSRFLVPIIKRVKQTRKKVLEGINSLLTNVDDGGATKTLIDLLEANGYGVTPPVGDQVNALFNSFLTADKIFTILDDSGRIKDGYLGLKVIGNKGSRILHDLRTSQDFTTLEEVIVEAFKLARQRDKLFEGALQDLSNNKLAEAKQGFDNILAQFKMIGIGDNLELRYEGGAQLYKIASGEVRVSPQQIVTLVNSARNNNLKLSEDFFEYSINLFNLARIMDSEIKDKNGNVLFNIETLIVGSHSIRNLLLIAAMYDQGLLVKDPARPAGDNALPTLKMHDYQSAVDRLAESVGITEGTVSLSSAHPSVLYSQYEDNIFAWREVYQDQRIQRRIRFHSIKDREGNMLEFKVELDLSTAAGLEYTQNGIKKGPLSKDYKWEALSLNNKGDVLVINTQGASEKEKLEIKIDDSGKVQFDFKGYKWSIEENDSGDKTEIIHDNQRMRALNDNPGRWYDDSQGQDVDLLFGRSLPEDVMFVPRFVAMQTFITEIVNLSKMVDFGFSEPDQFFGRKMYKAAPEKTIDVGHTNPVAMDLISNTGKFLIAGPGSFFTSLVAHDMCEGIVDELVAAKKRGAVTIFVFNANQDNETVNLVLLDMVKKIETAIRKGNNKNLEFGDLFSVAILGNKIDYQTLFAANRITDKRKDIKENVGDLLTRKPASITNLELNVFKTVLDKYIIVNNIAVPVGTVDPYVWIIQNAPKAVEEVASYAEKFAKKLYEEVDVDRREPGKAADMAKRSRGVIEDPDGFGFNYLQSQGVTVVEASLLGLVTSIDRGSGKSKDSLGFIGSRFEVALDKVLPDGGTAQEEIIASLPVKVSDFAYDVPTEEVIEDSKWEAVAGEFFDEQHIRQIAAALQQNEEPKSVEVKYHENVTSTGTHRYMEVWVYLKDGNSIPFDVKVTDNINEYYPRPLNGHNDINLVRFGSKTDGGLPEDKTPETGKNKYAGIDFRVLSPTAQSLIVAPNAFAVPAGLAQMSAAALSDQWSALEKKIQYEAVPYAELKDFVATVSSRSDCYKQKYAVIDYIMRLLGMEENVAVPTSPELKEILAYLR